MNMYKIRVTGDVLDTTAATRRVTVDGQVLTFGREPVYLRADELPAELANDPHLRIEVLAGTVGDTEPTGNEVIDLKSERVQEPEATVAPEPEPGDEIDLKSERVQEPGATVAPEPEPEPGDEIDLKSERVQEPGASVSPEPEPEPGEEIDLKSERVQEPAAAVAARRRR